MARSAGRGVFEPIDLPLLFAGANCPPQEQGRNVVGSRRKYYVQLLFGNIDIMTKTIAPVSPGEMLEEEFLNPLGMSKYRLAKNIGVPAQRIGDIVSGKRGITADTDLRLCRFFGLSDGWWLRLQVHYDTVIAKKELAQELAKIVPMVKAA